MQVLRQDVHAGARQREALSGQGMPGEVVALFSDGATPDTAIDPA
jgi:hypothetical protein